MITSEALIALLHSVFPESHVEVFDKTGQQDHYVVYVRAVQFEGLPIMQRIRLVNAAVTPLLQSGELHAIEIKTDLPSS